MGRAGASWLHQHPSLGMLRGAFCLGGGEMETTLVSRRCGPPAPNHLVAPGALQGCVSAAAWRC